MYKRQVQYGFYGMIGWRIDLNAGKRWSGLIHEKVDLELSRFCNTLPNRSDSVFAVSPTTLSLVHI